MHCNQNSTLLFKYEAAQQAGLENIVGLNADRNFFATETVVTALESYL